MRIRTVKPEFFLHFGLFKAEKETGLPLRVAFEGLWCAADREGRFKWEPERLKVQILPYDEVDFSRVLDALTTRGFLVSYASGDSKFGWIPSFKKHQFVNPREVASELPDPMKCAYVPDLEEVDESMTRDPRVTNACSTRHSLPVPNTVPVPEGESEGKPEKVDIHHYHEHARSVLHILNEAAGCRFTEVDTNLSVISARLREPEVTLEGVRQMIDRMCSKWKGTDMADYLRPETLFRKSKFNGYYAQRNSAVIKDNGRSGQPVINGNTGTLNVPSAEKAARYSAIANRGSAGTV
jgi:uncharacterized phage protein (TIGR02220 family)